MTPLPTPPKYSKSPTPEEVEEARRVATAQAGGCGSLIVYFLLWFAVLTPSLMIGWNTGLENAGIVSREISWTTAFGLAVLFTLFRGILLGMIRAAR